MSLVEIADEMRQNARDIERAAEIIYEDTEKWYKMVIAILERLEKLADYDRTIYGMYTVRDLMESLEGVAESIKEAIDE